MAEDLLAKEKEFHRLNKELEEKTQQLMKEVDSVMMGSTNNSYLSTLNPHYSSTMFEDTNKILDAPTLMERQSEQSFLKKNISSPSFFEKTHQFPKENAELRNQNDFPVNEKNSKTETMIQLLKSKIKSQENEIQATQTEYKKKCNYCKELEAESEKQAETKEKLQNQISYLKDTVSKIETLNGTLQLKIQEQNVESAALKKEIEDLKKEVRSVNQQNLSTEVRLNRSLEENEKLRGSLKFSKLEEKDLRDQIRRSLEEKRLTIKNMEKQRAELYHAYKKQLHLVDNLKKQKVYLEASRQIKITEEDFSKLLDWKPERDL